MTEFNWFTATTIFFTYIIVDMLYAWYIISVEKRQAAISAALSALIYSLLAYGVVSFSQNIWYLVPLASGAFIGTYLTVRYNVEKK